ncbi:MAG: LppX_LprAFG lipoprotein [Candidatus Nanopelagicales bacterium]
MRRPSPALTLVGGAHAGALRLTGCGAATGTAYKTTFSADNLAPAAAVTAATDATARTGSASVRLTISATTADGATQKAEVRGAAALDGSTADLTATLPAGEGGAPLVVRQRVVDGVGYVKVEGSDVLPSTWIKLDPATLPDGLGDGLGAAVGGSGTDAVTAPLDALRQVADVTKVGAEEIDGIATTHYRATLDPAKIAAAMAGLPGAGLRTGAAATPVDLWVDADGHVVRVTQKVDAGPSAGSLTWTLDLREFGTRLDVRAPSGAVDVGSILGTLGGLAGGDGQGLADLEGLLEGLVGGDGQGLDGLQGLLDGLGAGTTTS